MSGSRQPEEIEMHEKAVAAVAECERLNPSPRPPNLFQAQFDGVKAFLEGKTAIDCPFTDDQSEYYSWFNGFSSAENQSRENAEGMARRPDQSRADLNQNEIES